jgi:hypothetical protein
MKDEKKDANEVSAAEEIANRKLNRRIRSSRDNCRSDMARITITRSISINCRLVTLKARVNHARRKERARVRA